MSEVIVLSPSQLEGIIEKAILRALDARPGPSASHPGKYITKKDAAEICRVTVRTVEQRMKEGLYRYKKDGTSKTSRVRIVAEDVYKSMESGINDRRYFRGVT